MATKLTTEILDKYLLTLKTRHIKLNSVFTKTSDKHSFECLIDGTKWETSFSNVVHNGTSCPQCSSTLGKVRIKPEDIEQSVKTFRLRGIAMLEAYKGSKEKHKFQCLNSNCNHIWLSSFDNINRGRNCPKCRYVIAGKNKRIKSNEALVRIKELEKRNIKLISEYTYFNDKHDFKCLVLGCNHTWSATLDSVYRGSGCNNCGKKIVKRKTEFDVNQVHSDLVNRNIKIISEIGFLHRRHTFTCTKPNCNHVWNNTLYRVWIKGSRCEKCIGKFLDQNELTLRKIELNNRNIELVSEFVNVATKTEFRCLVPTCDHHWITAFSSVYSGKKGCPRCAGRNKTDEEKLRIEAHSNIRKRLSALAKKLSIDKPYKTNGEYNELVSYFADQYVAFIKSNPKPTGVELYELDHIIPVSMFSPFSMEELKLCWHKNNLQWLTKFQNISKLNRIRPEDLTQWHHEVLTTIGVNITVC